ncbi:recombinase family protein [Ruminococcus sp. XPD3002]|uniref:recombinase family protein n=1 Tax=Ruminococcus sp. XPD3002 TaxID=1452269 RepID=UPI00091F0348|nr:hypothetical protein SAMN04487832_1146 [Ruminococcus flavefaciens]
MLGYRIIDGIAKIDESEASAIRAIFSGYISGMSLREAAEKAGKPMVHSMVKRVIRNICYIGDDFYPAIVSRQTFTKANAELIRRAEKHGGKKRLQLPPVYTEFEISEPEMHFDDPIKQAEYIYSLIGVRK